MDEMIKIEQNVTLEDVKAAKPKTIFYGANTCWWTHDPEHLGSTGEHDLPCDPRGGVLMEAHDFDQFLSIAEMNPRHYGKHGLAAFMAAHHPNCRLVPFGSEPSRPWCLGTWVEYNAALDAQMG